MIQTYKNHRQIVPGFHILTFLLILAGFIGAIVNLVNSVHDHSNLYSASLILLINIVLGLIAYYARRFALKAQDRAIRAEENLRHFALTGRLHDPSLQNGQIIALRFAGDEEYIDLVKLAITKNLTNDEIKKEIKNWKPDLNRV